MKAPGESSAMTHRPCGAPTGIATADPVHHVPPAEAGIHLGRWRPSVKRCKLTIISCFE